MTISGLSGAGGAGGVQPTGPSLQEFTDVKNAIASNLYDLNIENINQPMDARSPASKADAIFIATQQFKELLTATGEGPEGPLNKSERAKLLTLETAVAKMQDASDRILNNIAKPDDVELVRNQYIEAIGALKDLKGGDTSIQPPSDLNLSFFAPRMRDLANSIFSDRDALMTPVNEIINFMRADESGSARPSSIPESIKAITDLTDDMTKKLTEFQTLLKLMPQTYQDQYNNFCQMPSSEDPVTKLLADVQNLHNLTSNPYNQSSQTWETAFYGNMINQPDSANHSRPNLFNVFWDFNFESGIRF